jgi:hypothetical protein
MCSSFETTTIVVDSEIGDEIPPEEEDLDGVAFVFLAILLLCVLAALCMFCKRRFADSKMGPANTRREWEAHSSGSRTGFPQHHNGQSIAGQPYPVSRYGNGGGLQTLSPVPVSLRPPHESCELRSNAH